MELAIRKKTTVTISESTYHRLLGVRDAMKRDQGVDRVVDDRVTFDFVIDELIKCYDKMKGDLHAEAKQ